MAKNRNSQYICIHGHFYQPPRENPWVGEVVRQDSAHPFHDWNQKINKECYAANVSSSLIDSFGKNIKYINNYSGISFNFGPTLLSWLKLRQPETYQAILKADKDSQKKFSGHGSAIAQCYNHLIMPLANYRDKRTQVIWGIADFKSRFQRNPEGIWLPETAVDLETLSVLADEGIKFTILAPHQAKSVRKIGRGKWENITAKGLDSQVPYLCRLSSGKSLSIFFYNGAVSRDVAFGSLLDDGEYFMQSLLSLFVKSKSVSELVNIAIDGETFGHHHRFGNMALSYCLDNLEKNKQALLTVYGEYLAKFPPAKEVKIVENSSWSCSHGVERWKADCGCNSGMHPGWKQLWRPGLRKAMDWLRDELADIYEVNMPRSVKDSWKIRDDYISIILDRSVGNLNNFFKMNLKTEASKSEKVKILKLVEMQHNAMLMYTSCGWFFDDISGIETIQVIQFAIRAIQLAEEISSEPILKRYLQLLKKTPSNLSEISNGFNVYEQFVKLEMFNCSKVNELFNV